VSIAKHLQYIVEKEQINADESVLCRVARLANGSMRDALSLLDKLLSYDAKNLTVEVANEIIPPPHDELAFAVVACVAQQDAAGALRALDDALQSGRTVDRFCDHLIEHFRTLMLLRVCGGETDIVDVSQSMRFKLSEQAEQFDAPTFVYMITLLEELRRNVKFSGAARALADAAVVRLAMSRQFTDIHKLIEQLDDETAGNDSIEPRASEKKKEAPSRAIAGRVVADRVVATETPRPQAAPSKNHNPEAVATRDAPRSDAHRPPPKKLSAAERDRVASDPLVERVKEAVNGTLMEVRSLGALKPPDTANDDHKTNASDDTESSLAAKE
jgi:DNA polymerase-3 subunit gamma/tau